MGDFTGGAKLNYNDYKVSLGLFGRSAKKAANAKMKEACSDNNGDVKTNNSKGAEAKGNVAEGEDDTDYALDDGEDGENVADDNQVNADNAMAEGDALMPTLEELGALAEVNTVQMQDMQANCEAGKEEIMAQIAENMTMMQDGLMQASENAAEMETITAEIEQLTAEEEGGAAGGFSTGMAAAGGQNSAYSLSVPTGGNQAPAKGGKKQGGLISSGAPATNPMGGAQGGQAAGGAQGSQGSDRSAEIQAKYARLADIEAQNVELTNMVMTCADNAITLQMAYCDEVELVMEAAEEEQALGNEEVLPEIEQQDQTFAKIQEVGMYVQAGGAVVQGVGVGMITSGTLIDASGKVIKASGTVMQGIGAGLKALGAALLPGVFTAPAGSAVGASGTGVTMAGKTTQAAGGAIEVAGTGVQKAGLTVRTVGQGISIAGEATSAVGSAGQVVTAIKNGQWLAAIGAGLSCLGSAMACVNDVQAFTASINGVKDAMKAVTLTGEKATSAAAGLADKGAQVAGKAVNIGTQAASKTTQTLAAVSTGLTKGGQFVSGLQDGNIMTGIAAALSGNTANFANQQASQTQQNQEDRQRIQDLTTPNSGNDGISQADRNAALAAYPGKAADINKCTTKAELDALLQRFKNEQPANNTEQPANT
ncbi:hypothetical protein IJ818_01545 [bacterium]|nr:hypothetical protein [bacterium]